MSAHVRLLFPRALVDFLRLVVVGLEEIRDEIDGQWEDDRRVLLRRNGVQRLQDKRAHMLMLVKLWRIGSADEAQN